MPSFYSRTISNGLRFGDVVSGFPLITSKSDKLGGSKVDGDDVIITINKSKNLVVMTPCCSIEDGSIALAPLQQVRPAFLKNEYFVDDLTRINRIVPSENSLPQEAWNHMSPEEANERRNQEPGYMFLECFVFMPNAILPEYRIKESKIGHYMVDFKSIYRFESTSIKRSNGETSLPQGCNKSLQLTALARNGLREKLTSFFARVPDEDRREMLSMD